MEESVLGVFFILDLYCKDVERLLPCVCMSHLQLRHQQSHVLRVSAKCTWSGRAGSTPCPQPLDLCSVSKSFH